MTTPPTPRPTGADALRATFLNYFAKHGHSIVKSSPLPPANDPTLMFTNAGMVQFKEVFVGAETRPYKRATTCQKCMRVSGKHNDLEEVGRTARHHTFFEMLGNFSFGDYFKEEAIKLAWEFVTQEVALPKDRIYITIFGGAQGMPADDEARQLWRKISGLPNERILPKGMKDNFWAMGDTGPCGPCTEIHVDQGRGPVTDADFDNGRVMEIWNNVFMQFDRQPDGRLVPLPAPSVDTGMGLERLAALTQHQDSNYHSDMFSGLLDTIAHIVGKPYTKSPSEDDVSMRVIADHARATAFLVADGIQPSNEGRGYVMRRIMRRAIRHGKRLGLEKIFMPEVADYVVGTMGPAYPELTDARSLIDKVAATEEEGFRRTLDTGLRLLAEEVEKVQSNRSRSLPGEVVFKLYDTYGFPKDLTEVIASEHDLSIDEAGFNTAMQAQKERSRGGDVGQAAVSAIYKVLREQLGETPFVGYFHEDDPTEGRTGGTWQAHPDGAQLKARVIGLLQDGKSVQHIESGQAEVVLAPTPFYGESGGQVGDVGRLFSAQNPGMCIAHVTDSKKPLENFIVSHIEAQKPLTVGEEVWATYDVTARRNTRAHHSATHLLHGALRRVLGEHVKQAGSLVDAHHLRFDFSHFSALSDKEIAQVEEDVNTRIAAGAPVVLEELSFEEARAKGAIALFGEKYGDRVRVISMGDSTELCGGTHARSTADLQMLLISREQAVQSGVRRVEARVADAAHLMIAQSAQVLDWVGTCLSKLSTQPKPPQVDATLQPIIDGVTRALTAAQELGQQAQAQGLAPAPLVPFTCPKVAWSKSHGYSEAAVIRRSVGELNRVLSIRAAELSTYAQDTSTDTHSAAFGLTQVLLAARHNERLLAAQQKAAQSSSAATLLEKVTDVGGVPLLAIEVPASDAAALRHMADTLRDHLRSYVVCLASSPTPGKVALLVAVSADLVGRFKAGNLVRELAPLVGGRGGGKPELAQAGGTDPAGIPEALEKIAALLRG